jgi:hypothetical protein
LSTASSGEFTAKGFPRPFPHSGIRVSSERSSDTRTYELAAASGSLLPIRYSRNLSGITGIVMSETEHLEIAPTGLGDNVDEYFNAHGYDANSRLHIMYAWREKNGIRDFVGYLCGKGMTKSEAEWVRRLLVKGS